MMITKCDICGNEYRNNDGYKFEFVSIVKKYWVFTSRKSEYLDVCDKCQRDLRKALDKKAMEELEVEE